MIRLRPLPAAFVLLCSASIAAQQVFHGGTDLVTLNVTVVDSAGRQVPGLEREHFQVFEDGVLQEVTNFTRDPRPIALSLVIDSSTSMEQRMAVAQQAAIGFARKLTAQDVAQVVDFDSQALVLQPFTADHAALEAAIRRTSAGGSTSLYNALYVALSGLREIRAETAAEIRRQAIVLLSDGEDTSSVVKYDEVLTLSKRSEVIVYAIGLRSRTDSPTRGWNEAEFVLRSLALETGGRSYPVDDASQLDAIYAQIADELANQYTLGYTSKNLKRDGAWRQINVKMTRPGTSARTKSGYFGPKAPR